MISLKMVKGAEPAEGVRTEQRLPEPPQRFVIGRDPGAHWPIRDRTLALSARHCEIVATPAGAVPREGLTEILRAAPPAEDDASAIRDYLRRRGARSAVVVGGGVLGVEAADALHKLGLRVTRLQCADRLMNAPLDEQGAARLQAYLESIGIQVVCGVAVTTYEGQPQLQAAWLSHGPRVRTDLFVAALGIQANTVLAGQAGLAPGDNGVRANRHMQTADPTSMPSATWPS